MTNIKKLPNRVSKSRTIPEVIEHVAQMGTREDKVALLKMYNTKTLRFVVDAMYNQEWTGVQIPVYVPNHRPVGICNMSLHNSLRRLEAAYKYRESNPEVTARNLEIALTEMSADESALLVSIIEGRKVAGISKAMWKEVYPDLFRFQESDAELETMDED